MARKKKLFVTGGSGFIGKNFIELAAGNYELHCPTHAELELTDSDAVEKYFRQNDFDVVLHMANATRIPPIGGLATEKQSSRPPAPHGGAVFESSTEDKSGRPIAGSSRRAIYQQANSMEDLKTSTTSVVRQDLKTSVETAQQRARLEDSELRRLATLGETNQCIFSNIVRCEDRFGRMIHLGSGAEYDKTRELKKVKETDFGASVPKDEYGLYKYLCSKYIERADNITCLRIFGCYGKHEDYLRFFISNAVCRAIFDLPIVIRNKNVFFDYLFVDDLVGIIRHFIDSSSKPKYKSYNATPDAAVDLLFIANAVNKVLGKELEIIVKNKGLGLEYSGDNSRLKEEIHGIRFTPLESGIAKLHDWYSANKKSLDYKQISERV